MKTKKKARYVSPRVTGTSALLLSLICMSLRVNVQVDELQNMNSSVGASSQGTPSDPFYFEF